jgi:energy-coupling factor transport system ATP-binding protein
VVLGDGDVVADGDARTVLAGSLFAPQVLRVLPPYLTVEEVATAVEAAR